MSRSNELHKRLFTGIVGGSALLAVIVFGGWIGVFFITIVISLGMIFEFSEMTLALNDRLEKRYVLLCLTWVMALLNFLFAQLEYALLITSFLGLFSYFLWTAKRHTEADLMKHFQELMYSVFGVTYLVFIPLFFARIYGLTHGAKWTILFLLIVWAGDSGAYFVGKKYGRRKLYPRMSPKKTWEGAFGGFLSGLVATVFFKVCFFSAMNWESVLILPCVVSPVAQIGDLCESFFKRAFDKKDSGSILPGHGGFLDRFDGVVFSLPVMYAFIRILG